MFQYLQVKLCTLVACYTVDGGWTATKACVCVGGGGQSLRPRSSEHPLLYVSVCSSISRVVTVFTSVGK